MQMVYIFLGTGFEELEAIAPCDILRRGGVEVAFVGIGGTHIVGGHGIKVQTDCLLEEVDLDEAEMIVIPGGLGGVESIENCEQAMNRIQEASNRGLYTAAICAGPRILAKLGILRGKTAVCYPGMEEQMNGGNMKIGSSTVQDEKVLTGRGPGAALKFGLLLLKVLRGNEVARQVATGMVIDIEQ